MRAVFLRRAALAVIVLAAALGFAYLTRTRSHPPPTLAVASHAYIVLGQALQQAGLLPLPTSAAELQAALQHGATGSAIHSTTAADGSRVWQVGDALTVLTAPGGGAARYLLQVQHWDGLGGQSLTAAVAAVAALPQASQKPVQLTSPDRRIVASQFYFTYSAAGHAWRFTPSFEGEQCVRIDVEQSR